MKKPLAYSSKRGKNASWSAVRKVHDADEGLKVFKVQVGRLPSFLVMAVVSASGNAQTISSPMTQSNVQMETGLWQMNARPEMVGGQIMVLPRSVRVCISSEDIQLGRINVVSMPACQVQAGGVWNGNTLALKLVCRGLPDEAEHSGTLQAQGKTLQGRVEVVLAPGKQGIERGHMIYHQTGSWVSADCPERGLR